MTLTDIILLVMKTIFITIPKYAFIAIFWIIRKTWGIFWEMIDVLCKILFGVLKIMGIFLLFAFLDNMDDMY
jgi:hypothetical protein